MRRVLIGLALCVVALCSGCAPVSTAKTSPSPTEVSTPSPLPSGAVAGADGLQQDLVSVVKRVAPSVVQIQTDLGLGSGIVFDGAGDIVTNNHVVEGANQFTVTFANGKKLSATLVGAYAPNDIAVVKVQPVGGVLTPAQFADSDKSQVGDIVMAIGNPLGLQSSVTEGIISAVGRTAPEGNGVTLPSVIQTSAAINPGNSGGALVDINGDVVGIPTLAAVDPEFGTQAPGIGFAIPSNTVKDLASQIIATGHVTNSHRAYIGVNVSNASTNGAIVVQVVAGGPAAKAGIVAGDTITAVNSTQIQTPDDLSAALAQLQPGQTVTLAISHQDGSTATVSVTLGQLPGS